MIQMKLRNSVILTLSSIKLAVVFSLSSTAASLSSSPSPKSSLPFPLSSNSKPSRPKATAVDLLSILGPPEQAGIIDPNEAQGLWSCLRFLVPFNKSSIATTSIVDFGDRSIVKRRSMAGKMREDEENELIWWPPLAVMELAWLSVDSGGDPDAIYRALDPSVIPVPDVEGSKECNCELTRTPYGRRFINEELNAYLAFLFEMIASRGPSVGLNVTLSRYDFFHGHLFLAKDTGRLGILFHAKEYPAYQKQVFPMNMGYCQKGSNVPYDDTMNLRNILWLAPYPDKSSKAWVAPGILVVLDAHPGKIIYQDLIPDYVKIARTLYEDDFGEVPVDVNYLNVGGAPPTYQIFIC